MDASDTIPQSPRDERSDSMGSQTRTRLEREETRRRNPEMEVLNDAEIQVYFRTNNEIVMASTSGLDKLRCGLDKLRRGLDKLRHCLEL